MTEARLVLTFAADLQKRKGMELLILVLVLLLVAVIAGLGLLLYQTISRRNIAMQQMAQAVRDLVERLPEEHKQHPDNSSSDNRSNNSNH